MRSVNNIARILPKHLFWDVKLSQLDVEEDKDLIIPRALMATTELTFDHDIAVLEKLYTRKVIIAELIHTKERISNKVCKLVAQRYHVKQFARFK